MEAASLDIADIHIDGAQRHVVIHGKGGKTRIVHIDDERFVAVVLRRHLRAMATAAITDGPAFRAAKNYVGGGLTYSRIQVLWDRYRAAAGHPDVEIHQLRHSYGTDLAADGISVTTIRAQLGHANLTTSQGYIDFTAADAAKELRERARRRRRG